MPTREKPEKRRRRPIQARSKATRSAILEAAAQLFNRGAATTTAIAGRAGVSIGSLYEYFRDKDAILESLIDRHVREGEATLAAVIGAIDPHRETLERGVQQLVHALLGLHTDRLGLHRRLIGLGMRFPAIQRRIHEAERRLRPPIEAWLRVHPEVHVGDPVRAARLVVRGTNALVHRHIDDPDGDTDEAFVDELCRLWVGYLKGAS